MIGINNIVLMKLITDGKHFDCDVPTLFKKIYHIKLPIRVTADYFWYIDINDISVKPMIIKKSFLN